jgi:hypothetical protein
MALPKGFTKWSKERQTAWLVSPEGLTHRDKVRASAFGVSLKRAKELRPKVSS